MDSVQPMLRHLAQLCTRLPRVVALVFTLGVVLIAMVIAERTVEARLDARTHEVAPLPLIQKKPGHNPAAGRL